MSVRFCEGCGAALAVGDVFCAGCGQVVEAGGVGAPVSSPTAQVPQAVAPQVPAPAPIQAPSPQPPAGYSPPPPTQPAPQMPMSGAPMAPPSAARRPLMLGALAAVVLAAVGGGWWYMNRGSKPPASADPNVPAASTTATPPPAPQKADGDDFLGRWFPEDLAGSERGTDVMTIVRQGPLLVGLPVTPSDGRMEFTIVPGPKLSGEFIGPDGSRTPVTAELLADKNKMILTLAPPASEFETVVLLRVNEEEAASASGGSPDTGPVTEDRARKLVAALPDVDRFVKELQAQGKKPLFDVSPEDAKTFMVHVYEIVDDGDGMAHSATFGWYKVDRETGAISPGM